MEEILNHINIDRNQEQEFFNIVLKGIESITRQQRKLQNGQYDKHTSFRHSQG